MNQGDACRPDPHAPPSLPPVSRSRRARAVRQAEIFAAYFAQFLKTRLAYRVDFLIDLGANLFGIGVQLAVLTAIFSKVQALQGWSFDEVLFIYGFSLLPLGLFNVVSVNLYRFSERYIADGNFDRVLLRPVNALAQVMFESFNVSGLNEILLGVGLTVYAGTRLELTPGVVDVLALLVMVPTATLIYVGVFLALTSVSFWAEDRMGLSPPVYNVIRFSRYPLTIFSTPVRLLLTFVLPFAWVAFYPSTWFLGTPEFREIALLTPVVGIVVFSGAYALWRRGMRRYASTGS
ncbi:MAG: ABC-2 family transporter protein [Candidatus Krumholzibacteriia bacterium]